MKWENWGCPYENPHHSGEKLVTSQTYNTTTSPFFTHLKGCSAKQERPHNGELQGLFERVYPQFQRIQGRIRQTGIYYPHSVRF
jgi:hypothetical protein